MISCELLGFESNKFLKILKMDSIFDQLSKNQFENYISTDKIKYYRDLIAKTLYSSMFDWIIKKINILISNKEMGKNKKLSSIVICDFLGFENIEENGIEQLVINYADERLQQFFINQFLLEQDDYLHEKIIFEEILFNNNKEIIDLIDHPNKSIFSILNSQLPKNYNENKFYDDIYLHLSSIKNIALNKKNDKKNFSVRHYCGEINYKIKGFVNLNSEHLFNEIFETLLDSKNKLIKYLIRKFIQTNNKNNSNKLYTETLTNQIKKKLDDLTKMLSQSNPSFIKCLRPNKNQKSNLFESIDVNRQLICSGLLEAIKIKKQGYTVKMNHLDFVIKYRFLVKGFNYEKSNCDYLKSSMVVRILKFT